ncbi:hypothetical protein SAMN05892883_1343 [Jatrophihabitans sp. GAS493]|uniref:hypothetical protein n=1 Tax=Jatrophihabitans sp. GAS493 TaxID=1907575 RepID=UPI000BB93E49|nr:hypothetical protein [Jatrophihabitans sp. GAS493]SOD71881.1 hypothetical protein SAMN05892883_1343 [Jatrophihabitans sp. GAS493]
MADDASGELDEIADDLYALLPEEFIAARNDREKLAKSAGNAELAVAIRALGKPNMVGWLANQLARQHADELAPLIDIGAAMREATRQLSMDQLRDLTARQRQLVNALVGQAKVIATAVQKSLSEENRRGLEATLHAALADEQAAQQLLAGRLTGPLRRSGFGEEEAELIAGATGSARPKLRLVASAGIAAEPATDPAVRRNAAALERAESNLNEAMTHAEAVSEDLAAARGAFAEAQTAEETAAAEVERLRNELEEALDGQRSAEREARRRQTQLQRHELATRQAKRALEKAVQAREELVEGEEN